MEILQRSETLNFWNDGLFLYLYNFYAQYWTLGVHIRVFYSNILQIEELWLGFDKSIFYNYRKKQKNKTKNNVFML